MGEDLSIAQYEDGDEAEINPVFNTVFNENRNLECWRWKFQESPIDSRPFIILARSKGNLVGQYACTACFLKYHDAVLKTAQPVDNFVHRDHRGGIRGVQVRMFLMEEDVWREQGIDLVFGFPNREAYITGKRLTKYRDLIGINNYFKLLSLRPVFKKYMNIPVFVSLADRTSRLVLGWLAGRRSPPPKNLEITLVDTIDERADGLWDAVSRQYDICVVRDAGYLKWRYCDKPDSGYHILQAERDGEVVGLAILKYKDLRGERIGFIMECLAIREAAVFQTLLDESIAFFSRNQVDYVLARSSCEDRVNQYYRKSGFSLREGIWDRYVAYGIYSSRVDESSVTDPSRWLMSFGDCDSL